MKKIYLIILFCTTVDYCGFAQSQTNTSDIFTINSYFDRIEAQGGNTTQNLRYSYFFFDKSKSKLLKLSEDLQTHEHTQESLEKADGGYILEVRKIEKHTRQSMLRREQGMYAMALKYGIQSYEGFDMGSADPTEAIVSTAGFAKFMSTKKGNELFALGMKLYNLRVNDKAEAVFRTCIAKKIKPDEAAFRLGNILLAVERMSEGIAFLEQAVQYNPGYIDAYYALGVACYESKEYERAIFNYEKANKLKPNDDRILCGIALVQYALHENAKSLANCKRALQINSNNTKALNLLNKLNNN